MKSSFKKTNHGVVINTNTTSLVEARKRKRIQMQKENRIIELEKRVQFIEETLSKILSKLSV